MVFLMGEKAFMMSQEHDRLYWVTC